jgi:hypothetical protein
MRESFCTYRLTKGGESWRGGELLLYSSPAWLCGVAGVNRCFVGDMRGGLVIRGSALIVSAVCVVVVMAFPPVARPESPTLESQPQTHTGCQSERAMTTPAPVNLAQVLRDVYALEDNHQEKLFQSPDHRLDAELASLFDPATPKSKLEQFYAMLFFIARSASHPGEEITLEVAKAQTLLVSSRVFSDPEFPRQIKGIHVSRKDRARPRYTVTFAKSEVWLPLNKGVGFGKFREGMCQHAKALVFYGSFAFSLALKDHGLEVSDFDNVDIWGNFGTRGMVDIDLNYVSVKSVEFMNGSTMGLVKAKVSRKEFEVNQHSFLLKVITTFVTDRSLQTIDW